MRGLVASVALLACASCASCASSAPPSVRGRTSPTVDVAQAAVEPAEAVAIEPAPPRAMVYEDAWKSFGMRGCAYLAPADGAVDDDGSVDVVFHFHAGQLADRDFRVSGLSAVIVSCGWGLGTAPYANAFVDPKRFDAMVRALTKKVGAARIGRLALAAWSAGFASVAKILGVPRYYAMTDAVILGDGLHAAYRKDREIDARSLDVFVRFARDAAADDKAMIVTHSAIVPPGYASSTEATRAVLSAIDVPTVDVMTVDIGGERMRPSYRADAGNLHVRGFRGEGPEDHFDHLHLVGDVLRTWLVPRWKTHRRPVYTPIGEQR